MRFCDNDFKQEDISFNFYCKRFCLCDPTTLKKSKNVFFRNCFFFIAAPNDLESCLLEFDAIQCTILDEQKIPLYTRFESPSQTINQKPSQLKKDSNEVHVFGLETSHLAKKKKTRNSLVRLYFRDTIW